MELLHTARSEGKLLRFLRRDLNLSSGLVSRCPRRRRAKAAPRA